MQKGILLFLCLATILPATAQEKNSAPAEIREYWFVMLTKGPDRSQDSATAAKIQEGHLANIRRLYNEGKLKVAGPFGEEGDWRGIFILDCATKEEAEKLLQTDPAIRSGRLGYIIRSWWTAPTGSFKPGKPE